MSYLLGTAIIGAIILFSFLWLVRQWKLAHEGVITRAKVTKRRRLPGNLKRPVSGVIEYDFLTPRGEFSRNSVFVGEAICHVHEEGSEIEVVYLKSNPSVSGTKNMVNWSREFLNMTPL